MVEDKLSYHTQAVCDVGNQPRNHFLHIIGPELYLSGKHPINYSDRYTSSYARKDGKKLFLTSDALHKKYQKILQVLWILNSRNVNVFAGYIHHLLFEDL